MTRTNAATAGADPFLTVLVIVSDPANREIVLVWAAGRPLAPAARDVREFAAARRVPA